MSVLAYAQMLAELLPTLLGILAAFSLLFAVMATLAMRIRGAAGVFAVWAVYVPAVCVTCVLQLTDLATGVSGSVARAGYYAMLSLAVIGVPLWCSARCLLWLATRQLIVQRRWQALMAWAVGTAAAPAGLVAMFAVEAVASALRGWFASRGV